MARNSIRDYSNVNSSNTDIQSIDISEGCSPAGINNAIREVMADLKDVSTGAVALESPAADSLSVTGDLTVDTNTLYVDSTNNRVGIGTASPSRKVAIVDNGAQTDLSIVSSTSGVSVLHFGDTDADNQGQIIYRNTNDQMEFTVNGSERMRITSAGNVQISSNGTPDTSGTNSGMDISAVYGTFQTNHGGNDYPILNIHTSGVYNRYLQFRWANTGVGSISTNGSTTSYNTTSDYRLKENVVADWDATTRLKQLNPVRFNFIADPDTTVDGFLAHEVQDVVPEAITGTKDAMRDEEYEVSAATGDIYTPATDDADEVIHSTDVERPEALAEGQQWRETTAAVMGTRSVPDYQGIDQSKLVPLLVKTIQELEARITALEAN